LEKTRRGIQSVEIASGLLVALARHVKPMALKDIAKAGNMTANKAHPYMVSFLNVGFVVQDGASSYYELGPLALQLGLAKLQRLEPVKEASPFVTALAEETEQSVAVAVWGNLGPTIVRLEEPTHPLHVNLRTGTVMSMINTATGRLFSAYMPPTRTRYAHRVFRPIRPTRLGDASARPVAQSGSADPRH
jgi:DNA-binding IclR family transcriptional regulator